jgi:hypothetical protein
MHMKRREAIKIKNIFEKKRQMSTILPIHAGHVRGSRTRDCCMIMDEMKNILLGIIIGDALGSAFDGLGRGHIRSHFKKIDGYVDPAPALKGKMERWKKPGFYSSISQFAILAAACPTGAITESFTGYVAASPDVKESASGIFRHPDLVEKNLIARIKNPTRQTAVPALPCVRVIPSSIALSIRDGSHLERTKDIISYVLTFTRDASTLSGALSIASLVRYLIDEQPESINYPVACIDSNELLIEHINTNPGAVFDAGANPEELTAGLREMNGILGRIKGITDKAEAEADICGWMNKRLKTPIARATVNMPHAIIPYLLALSAIQGDDPSALYLTATEGGQAAALTALSVALMTCLRKASVIPDILAQNLANKKKIGVILDFLEKGSDPAALVEDFLRTEASLTRKELEELGARQRHARKKPKKAPHRTDTIDSLSKYVVESWTRIDRAKWRKEKRKIDKRKQT